MNFRNEKVTTSKIEKNNITSKTMGKLKWMIPFNNKIRRKGMITFNNKIRRKGGKSKWHKD